jgi:hypothetical protein
MFVEPISDLPRDLPDLQVAEHAAAIEFKSLYPPIGPSVVLPAAQTVSSEFRRGLKHSSERSGGIRLYDCKLWLYAESVRTIVGQLVIQFPSPRLCGLKIGPERNLVEDIGFAKRNGCRPIVDDMAS